MRSAKGGEGENGRRLARVFDWGRVWVTLDPKGWKTGNTIAPRVSMSRSTQPRDSDRVCRFERAYS
jgi:hypothetical protein